MAVARYVLSPVSGAKSRAGLRAAWGSVSVCVFMKRRNKSFVAAAAAAGTQGEDVCVIAMITWEGVSLCILGTMDEMIQPKGEGAAAWKTAPPDGHELKIHQQNTFFLSLAT